VESLVLVDVPTRADMEEIEISSRLYVENGAAYMTATVLSRSESDVSTLSPVTFLLTGQRLVTVRYEEPKAISQFAARAQKTPSGLAGGDTVLVGLLEAIVDRLADILESAAHEVDEVSRNVFARRGGKPSKARDFQAVIETLGRKADLTSHLRESLGSLDRLFGFLVTVLQSRSADHELKSRIKTLSRDANSLSDHAAFVSQKITFLLDATLGMINIEQTATIKIFSVVAVVFLPPTLIASIYGMNFNIMPELSWPVGYPFAIVLMIGSAITPYLYFKGKGWL
jgi:magnesium transporter